MTCQRCHTPLPDTPGYPTAWGALHTGGWMCPECYAGLQALRLLCGDMLADYIAYGIPAKEPKP